ncbi:hypothetical protein GQ53DRAFT_241000 [Thozetella sp. PMI_491]|nr:hypothetical protein GQ53DRAFT_241000 [Thozetella sp. PMI_491]
MAGWRLAVDQFAPTHTYPLSLSLSLPLPLSPSFPPALSLGVDIDLTHRFRFAVWNDAKTLIFRCMTGYRGKLGAG